MTSIFLIVSEIMSDPLTVFARDSIEAHRIYQTWRDRHVQGSGPDEALIARFSEHDLAMQPQIAEAAQTGAIGVGWWIGHADGWVVTAPDADPRGAIAPPEPPVDCFVFDDGAGELVYVFAETQERAHATHVLWNLDSHGEPGEFQRIQTLSRWLLTGPKRTMREQMDLGLTGVGRECEDGFWRIFPADAEPNYGAR